MIEDRPVANMTDALQGAAPNVVIQQRSSNPNDRKTNFNIRGISTVNDNSPLFVIDGLVADGGSFDKLNPNDIENISILKDAGTAAIYGSRSSNGVVLVTTKKGKKNQRATVRLSGMMGWQNPDILFSPVKGYQNATLRNLAATNAGEAPLYTPDQIRDLAAHQNEESWFFDQIVRTALQQNYNQAYLEVVIKLLTWCPWVIMTRKVIMWATVILACSVIIFVPMLARKWDV